MKVLVTGGAGFIGSHLVEALIARGDDITIIDDLSTGTIDNFRGVTLNYVKFLQGSIVDTSFVGGVLKAGYDRIYHLAAVVGVYLCIKDPRAVFKVNAVGSEVLYEAVAELKHKPKVIITSTSEVAGKSLSVPLKEDSIREFGNTTVSRWVYGESKAIEEMMGIWYGNHFNFPIQIFRLFNVIGPRQKGEYGMVIPKLIKQALKEEPITVYGDGTQIRSFTWVGDVVNGIVDISNQDVRSRVLNLGNPRPISINELALMIKDKTKSSSPIVHIPFNEAFDGDYEEIHTRIPDSNLAQSYGFKLTTSFEEALDRCIEYIKEELK